MTTPPTDDRLARIKAGAAKALAAFTVFLCGWMAMKTSETWQMVAWSVAALAAALVGSALSRRQGRG